MIEETFATDAADGVLHVRGTLDGATVQQLRDLIAHHSHIHTRSLTIDLSEASYVSSVAIGAIARAAVAARGNDVELDLIARPGTIAARVAADHRDAAPPRLRPAPYDAGPAYSAGRYSRSLARNDSGSTIRASRSIGSSPRR